jgi:hypothetical protein
LLQKKACGYAKVIHDKKVLEKNVKMSELLKQ